MGQKTNGDYAREYTKLMGRNPEGIYLYKPAPYRACHPGSVGFFDNEGNWNEITDLEQPHHIEKAGFKPLGRTLSREDTREYKWDSRSSDGESELSLEGKTELSGVLTSAPIDVGANAKNKTGKSNKANLVTGSVVKHERLQAPFKSSVKDWIKENAKDLVQGDYSEDIKEHGVWVVRATYVTQECAITMDSARSQEFGLGGEVGATGIGKLGAGGSSLAKFKGAGWSTYTASESDRGLVISFSGLHFKLRPFASWRAVPLHQVEISATMSLEVANQEVKKPILDDNGNVTGYETFRAKGRDEDGNPILEKIDEEEERKAAIEKQKEAEEEEKRRLDEEFKTADNFVVDDEPVGMSEQDLEEEREAEEREKEVEKQERKERMEKAKKRLDEISKISDETKRQEEMEQWKKEILQTTLTTTTTERWR